MTKLSVDASSSDVDSASEIKYFTGLTELSIYEAKFSSLDLSYNRELTSVGVSGCYNLTTLTLPAENKVTTLTIANTDLTTLDISNTAITSIAANANFANANSLASLYISESQYASGTNNTIWSAFLQSGGKLYTRTASGATLILTKE